MTLIERKLPQPERLCHTSIPGVELYKTFGIIVDGWGEGCSTSVDPVTRDRKGKLNSVWLPPTMVMMSLE